MGASHDGDAVTPLNATPFAFDLDQIDVSASSSSIRQGTIHALRRAILSFQLKPGQRLVERELIERLGVSRTTLREALRELAAEGLVSVVPQKGARVCAPSLEDAVDLYEVRASLESLVVTRFVERASDEEVDALRGSVASYAAVARRTTDILALLSAKESFYEVLIKGARSHALQQLLESIKARVQTLRATSLSRPGRAAETVREMEGIVDAIAERDASRAAHLCAEHVRAAARNALSSLQESVVAG